MKLHRSFWDSNRPATLNRRWIWLLLFLLIFSSPAGFGLLQSLHDPVKISETRWTSSPGRGAEDFILRSVVVSRARSSSVFSFTYLRIPGYVRLRACLRYLQALSMEQWERGNSNASAEDLMRFYHYVSVSSLMLGSAPASTWWLPTSVAIASTQEWWGTSVLSRYPWTTFQCTLTWD